MDGARDARIERVDGAENFYRLFRVGNLGADQRCLIRGALSSAVARRSVPRAGDDQLVVVDLAILDADPVCQSASRSFRQTHTLRRGRPGGGFPLVTREGGSVAGSDLSQQFVVELFHPVNHELSLEASGRSPPQ